MHSSTRTFKPATTFRDNNRALSAI
jgi:hypothetical protein